MCKRMTMTICAISHAISQTSTERLDALFAVGSKKDAALLQALLLLCSGRMIIISGSGHAVTTYMSFQLNLEDWSVDGGGGQMEGKISGRTAVAPAAGKCATGSTLHHVMQQ